MVALLVLDRRSVFGRRMRLAVLYQCTQDAVSRSSSLRPVKVGWRSISSDLYSPTADSITALSRASPTLPIYPAIPASRSASVNAIAVY